jgi:hypothetical protein
MTEQMGALGNINMRSSHKRVYATYYAAKHGPGDHTKWNQHDA